VNVIRHIGAVGALLSLMSCAGPKDSVPAPSESSAAAKSTEKSAKAVDRASTDQSAKAVEREPPDLLTQVKEWRDKMCACADATCTERTYDAFRAWRKSLPRASGPGPEDPLEKLGDPWEKAEAELKACRKKYN
jgi:hypothetical protein